MENNLDSKHNQNEQQNIEKNTASFLTEEALIDNNINNNNNLSINIHLPRSTSILTHLTSSQILQTNSIINSDVNNNNSNTNSYNFTVINNNYQQEQQHQQQQELENQENNSNNKTITNSSENFIVPALPDDKKRIIEVLKTTDESAKSYETRTSTSAKEFRRKMNYIYKNQDIKIKDISSDNYYNNKNLFIRYQGNPDGPNSNLHFNSANNNYMSASNDSNRMMISSSLQLITNGKLLTNRTLNNKIDHELNSVSGYFCGSPVTNGFVTNKVNPLMNNEFAYLNRNKSVNRRLAIKKQIKQSAGLKSITKSYPNYNKPASEFTLANPLDLASEFSYENPIVNENILLRLRQLEQHQQIIEEEERQREVNSQQDKENETEHNTANRVSLADLYEQTRRKKKSTPPQSSAIIIIEK